MSYMKFILSFLIIFTSNAFGCSCLHNYKSYEEATKKYYIESAIVVSAKAVKIEQTTERGLKHQKVKWKIISSWKGGMRVNDTFYTVADIESDTCGYSVYEGNKIIFYEYDYGKFSIEMCSIGADSKSHAEQEKVLKRLRKSNKNLTSRSSTAHFVRSTVSKSIFCGFATQKYSTKNQLTNCG
jgi:hypothetical protein